MPSSSGGLTLFGDSPSNNRFPGERSGMTFYGENRTSRFCSKVAAPVTHGRRHERGKIPEQWAGGVQATLERDVLREGITEGRETRDSVQRVVKIHKIAYSAGAWTGITRELRPTFIMPNHATLFSASTSSYPQMPMSPIHFAHPVTGFRPAAVVEKVSFLFHSNDWSGGLANREGYRKRGWERDSCVLEQYCPYPRHRIPPTLGQDEGTRVDIGVVCWGSAASDLHIRGIRPSVKIRDLRMKSQPEAALAQKVFIHLQDRVVHLHYVEPRAF
ncbi:hypothetical protein P691DRAFT_782786 [Macrolepiota fuliginosa MF-IS2]|uniref:Uncharacterized protein n=1 Tax=Macrolepiota fuliginosa MF-IS2 TaxID=1400762 RepID=A0A9P5XBD6_9AGAR|nr:hypothetical protein P691DRAFT_782786 [Macrolepiota fuliginosa MF-IS2]